MHHCSCPNKNIGKLNTKPRTLSNRLLCLSFDKTNNLKGFKKYLGEEDKLQRSVVTYLNWEYPEAIFTHVPNEGRRTPFERFKFKHLGKRCILIENSQGQEITPEK